MQRERKLGRGLGQLISSERARAASVPETASPPEGRVLKRLTLEQIDPNPWQPRKSFPSNELEDLVNSIRSQGLLQPITVRPRRDRYELVAGERRVRACKELGHVDIDAFIMEAADQQMLEWAIIENLQRASLDPVETARSFRRLMDEFVLTQDEASRRLGQSRAHLANTLRLLDLPVEILEFVSRGTIAPGAARALIAVADRSSQGALAKRISDEGLSVRQVEALVRDLRRKKDARVKTVEPNRAAAEEQLQEALGTKVRIEGKGGKGVIKIAYHSDRQLNELFRRLAASPAMSAGERTSSRTALASGGES
jgi:ParB family transcriptional regulator, chromosome partitioning protein